MRDERKEKGMGGEGREGSRRKERRREGIRKETNQGKVGREVRELQGKGKDEKPEEKEGKWKEKLETGFDVD